MLEASRKAQDEELRASREKEDQMRWDKFDLSLDQFSKFYDDDGDDGDGGDGDDDTTFEIRSFHRFARLLVGGGGKRRE